MSRGFRIIVLSVFLQFLTGTAYAQYAQFSGQVADPQRAVIVNAEVRIVNQATGVERRTKTNDVGQYVVPFLIPGQYRMFVQAQGFETAVSEVVTLNVGQNLTLNFQLRLGSPQEQVTVYGGPELVNKTDGSVSTVVDQTYVKNLPLNGRSLQSLILLTPGVVTASPQTGGTIGTAGEFSVNGQRTESNYYTVDGVAANTSTRPVSGGIVFPSSSGSTPTATALGTTQGLVSVDALEEFRIQSSTYSAEFGRNPGGQFSFATRSGTNQLHGTAFDYLRNDVFDASDWFNGFLGLPKPALRQNDFGGTLGGPVLLPRFGEGGKRPGYNGHNRTFFFFNYEGLRLLQPQAAVLQFVPDANLRATTPAPLQQVLNAFPLPNCTSSTPTCQNPGGGVAGFRGTWSNPGHINSYSVRIDHAVNDKLKLFFRFADASSAATRRSILNASNVSLLAYTTRTYTLGATSALSSRLSNDFRLNYSSNNGKFADRIESFGGSQPVDLGQLQGLSATSTPNFSITVGINLVPATSLLQDSNTNVQKQWNVVDTVNVTFGRHQLRLGVDYRRLSPVGTASNPSINYVYNSQTGIQTNHSFIALAVSSVVAHPFYSNFSAYVQDQWRVSSMLVLSLGLRWDVNPAPGAPKGNLPYTVTGSTLGTLALAPQGTPLWNTAWYNFAPRLGAAYTLRNAQGWETVVRGGAGVFFDTGQQLGSFGYLGPGFSARNIILPGPAFPAPVTAVTPTIINPPVPRYGNVYAFPTHFQLPYTLQWSTAIEQALGRSQALTVSYVGSHASRLLEQRQVKVSLFNPMFTTVFFNQNGLTSDYDALQVQFQRRLSHGLTALVSYTWSHSIDYGSQSSALPYLRGNSDFDLRHNFSGALSYDLPKTLHNRFARALLHHWGLDSRFTARTGFPVFLFNGSSMNIDPVTGDSFFSGVNIVPGMPVYLSNPKYPGGRSINPSAFSAPAAGQRGNAPRNFARGFGAWQMDFAVRREFPIHEKLKLQFRADAFNIFNHPNFGVIDNHLGDTTFGQATGTLAQSSSILSPLYQVGGARSMQFSLKIIF